MRRGGWIKRAVLAAPLVVVALWLGATTTLAHSYFVESDPPDGAILARAPARVTLIFSSAVTPDFTSVELVEAQGRRYQPTFLTADPRLPTVVSVGLPAIPNGSYRLAFATRDRVDLHRTSGTVVFGVGVASAASAPQPQAAPAQPSEYLLRWPALAGLAALLGGLVQMLLVAPRLPARRARGAVQRAALRLGLGGVALQLLAGTALLVVQAAGLGADLRRTLPALVTGSEYGGRWLATTLLSLAVGVFLLGLWRRAGSGEVRGLGGEFRRLGPLALLTPQARTVGLALGLAAATAVSGHAAGSAGVTATEVLVRTVHLAAMGVWAGGVAALVVALLTLRRIEAHSAGAATALVSGFGPWAAASFAALGASGLVLSGTQVATVTALLSTSYGAVLIAKVALTGLVALVALRHALLSWRAVRRLPARVLPTLTLEAGGALAVVLLAALLGSSAPARGPRFESAPAPTATLVSRQSGELLAAVSVKPNRPGPNLLSAQVVDSRRPSLAPIEAVTIVLRRPGSLAAESLPTTRTGTRFDAGSVVLAAGDADVSVVVRRVGLPDIVFDTPWRVGPAPIARAPVVLSAAPLAPALNAAAAVVVVLAALAGLVRCWRIRLGRGVLRGDDVRGQDGMSAHLSDRAEAVGARRHSR